MDLSVPHATRYPLHRCSSKQLLLNPNSSHLIIFKPFSSPSPNRRRSRLNHKRPVFVAVSSANPNGSNGFSWLGLARSIQRGSERFWMQFGAVVKRETGVDFEDANSRVNEFVGRVRGAAKRGEDELDRFRTELLPAFVNWNRWECWKDLKNWEAKRIGALILYSFIVIISFRGIYFAFQAPRLERQRKEVTEAYMEALIPEPSPSNIRKFKKGMWRKTMPKGLKMKKFIERPDGMLIHDSSYIGEDA